MRVNPSPAFPLFIVFVEAVDTCGTDFGWICFRGGEGYVIVVMFYFQGGRVLTKAFFCCIFAVEKEMFVGTLDWTGRKDLASLQTLPSLMGSFKYYQSKKFFK
jgi:hypothetical protein